MITIRSIDHVVFRVRDMDRMVRFYCDLLGARLEKVQAEFGLYQLRTGDALIDLVQTDDRDAASGAPNVDHVAFRVLPWDSAALLGWLSDHGIAAEVKSRYGADGQGPSIYLTDPEGNGLELKGPPWPPRPPA